MLREAEAAGLLLDQNRTSLMLGLLAHSQDLAVKGDFICPDPTAPMHASLVNVWWLVEFLVLQLYERKTTRWKVGAAARRRIPECAFTHQSVLERMRKVPNYYPPNLPRLFTIERS